MEQLTVPVIIDGQVRQMPAECVMDPDVFNSTRSATYSMQIIRPIYQDGWRFEQTAAGEWYGFKLYDS